MEGQTPNTHWVHDRNDHAVPDWSKHIPAATYTIGSRRLLMKVAKSMYMRQYLMAIIPRLLFVFACMHTRLHAAAGAVGADRDDGVVSHQPLQQH